MSVLNDLAERCEDAEGASFVLEQEIGKALGFPGIAPPFTASVDRAMTLVPADWTMGRIFWPGYDNGKWTNNARVDLHHQFSSGGGPKVTSFAATPALALCAAALKSRAA